MEMVRIGSSASNKQPWRLLLSQDKKFCHFYLAHTPNYVGNKLGYDMQMLDIGIAMSHFESACKELGLSGEWKNNNPKVELPNTNYEYITSWMKYNESGPVFN